MKKVIIFLGMFSVSCLLVNRVSASSCHGGGDEYSGCYQHEKKSVEKNEVKKTVPRGTFYSKIYVCPMHPEVKSDKPGKCPECGMKLEKKQILMTYVCSEKDCEYQKSKPGKCPQHGKKLIKTEVENAKTEGSCPMPEKK